MTAKKLITSKKVLNGTSKTATKKKSVQKQSTARKIVTINPAPTKSSGESTSESLQQRVLARVLPGTPPRDDKVPAASQRGVNVEELRALFASHGGTISNAQALNHFGIKEKGSERFKQLLQLLRTHTTTVAKGTLQLKLPEDSAPRAAAVPLAAAAPAVVDLTPPRSAKRSRREDSDSEDMKPVNANRKQGSSMFVPSLRSRPPSVVQRTEGKRSEAERAAERGQTQWMNARVRITGRIYNGETGLVIDQDGDLCHVQLDSRDKPVRIFATLLKRGSTQSNKSRTDHVGTSVRVGAKRKAKERFECIVCTDVKAAAAFGPAITAQCAHPRRVCRECMANTIHMEVAGKGNFGDILCPHNADGCCAKLAYADIQREAHEEDFERYDSTLARRAMEQDVGFRWCAHGCGNGHFLQATGPNTHFECQHCKERTCAHHRCAWHSGRSCVEYDADARQSEEVALLQYLEQEGTVRCPKCNHGIEKRSGCDHMTCSQSASGCGAEFCFRCGADYKGPRGIFPVGNHAHKASCRHYFPPPQ